MKHCMCLNHFLDQLLLNYSLQNHKKWATPGLTHTACAGFSPEATVREYRRPGKGNISTLPIDLRVRGNIVPH